MSLPVDASSQHAVSPNTLYYLALYVLVLVVSFFKLRRVGAAAFEWKRVFYVGLELVYTASGLVVLLLADLKDYAAFIIVAYLIVILISSQIETLEHNFPPRGVFLTHLLVLVLVAGTTVIYFDVLQPKIEAERLAKIAPPSVAVVPEKSEFRVAIPYTDLSLAGHFGPRFNRSLVTIQKVTAPTEREARHLALEKAREEVKPFLKKAENDSSQIALDADKIVVERLRS